MTRVMVISGCAIIAGRRSGVGCRARKGSPYRPLNEYAEVKKKVAEDYRKKPRCYGFYAWKYGIHKQTVAVAVKAAGLKAVKGQGQTRRVPLSYASELLNEWGRAQGINKYLEAKREDIRNRHVLVHGGGGDLAERVPDDNGF